METTLYYAESTYKISGNDKFGKWHNDEYNFDINTTTSYNDINKIYVETGDFGYVLKVKRELPDSSYNFNDERMRFLRVCKYYVNLINDVINMSLNKSELLNDINRRVSCNGLYIKRYH
ncbi:hypothetical protein KQI61_15490 [Anaerocolumna aminovalerica]|uniref:hypothetical protein n=1 Tax=Anaerocolumna aminovalerica TaxID=1527 RepID=UPI001C0EA378|nr:hypothetical protein [Anaerocolumna aminovalerica]MBU5333602.1 hypothetical protein [Anaerocolumna aminovalerica]